MTYEHLLVSSNGPIATITLNRPEKRNALAMNVMLELTLALREVARSEALGVILAANGPVFSCLLYTSPSPRDRTRSRMPSSA